MISVATLATGLVLVAACVSDGDPISPSLDGSTEGVDGALQPNPKDDGSTPEDAGVQTDAGADAETDAAPIVLPEDDAGTTDDDAGVDAGPSCSKLTTGPFVTATCSATLPSAKGGALTTTTYTLTGVEVYSASCSKLGLLNPYEHRGALEVTATSGTTATFAFIDQYRKPPKPPVLSRITTRQYSVDVTASGGNLTFTPLACNPGSAPATASYRLATVNGKKTMFLGLPYGSGSTATYIFTEQ